MNAIASIKKYLIHGNYFTKQRIDNYSKKFGEKEAIIAMVQNNKVIKNVYRRITKERISSKIPKGFCKTIFMFGSAHIMKYVPKQASIIEAIDFVTPSFKNKILSESESAAFFVYNGTVRSDVFAMGNLVVSSEAEKFIILDHPFSWRLVKNLDVKVRKQRVISFKIHRLKHGALAHDLGVSIRQGKKSMEWRKVPRGFCGNTNNLFKRKAA